MLKKLILLLACLSTIGCATRAKVAVIDEAAQAKLYPDLTSDTAISMNVPSNTGGMYADIDQFNFTIKNGPHKGNSASVIMGRKRGQSDWLIIQFLIQQPSAQQLLTAQTAHWRILKKQPVGD